MFLLSGISPTDDRGTSVLNVISYIFLLINFILISYKSTTYMTMITGNHST
ncbi:hypothetical protein (plasmid) [Erwinia amylovora ATCC 49946]|nr:hypothetical protein [Erwinia amylovora ATCC 49946]